MNSQIKKNCERNLKQFLDRISPPLKSMSVRFVTVENLFQINPIRYTAEPTVVRISTSDLSLGPALFNRLPL